MKLAFAFVALAGLTFTSCRSGAHTKCEAYGGSAPTAKAKEKQDIQKSEVKVYKKID